MSNLYKHNRNAFGSFAASLGVVALMSLLFAITGLLPVKDPAGQQQVAVIFEPGTSKVEGIRNVIAAGGMPVRNGAFDFILIAAFEKSQSYQKLYEHEAWLVINPIVSGACATRSQNKFVDI